jgi:hypothetical protein
VLAADALETLKCLQLPLVEWYGQKLLQCRTSRQEGKQESCTRRCLEVFTACSFSRYSAQLVESPRGNDGPHDRHSALLLYARFNPQEGLTIVPYAVTCGHAALIIYSCKTSSKTHSHFCIDRVQTKRCPFSLTVSSASSIALHYNPQWMCIRRNAEEWSGY